MTVTVAENSCRASSVRKMLSPGRSAAVLLHLKEGHGWYDFTVKTEGSDAEAHFAGQVETAGSQKNAGDILFAAGPDMDPKSSNWTARNGYQLPSGALRLGS